MARVQEKKRFKIIPKNVRISDHLLEIKLHGDYYKFDLTELSSLLAKATKSQRENYNLSPSGYGIHWPEIDEDISLFALLKDKI